jgi:hypothetical protein
MLELEESLAQAQTPQGKASWETRLQTVTSEWKVLKAELHQRNVLW